MKISTRRLLEFFDEAPEGTRGHATAIVAVMGEDLGAALACHFLRSHGSRAEVLDANCTQGTRRGVRLDRWIDVTTGRRRVLYQTEVKNWSAHAIGGERLQRQGVSATKAARYRMDSWNREWSGRRFYKANVQKVLTPMRPPNRAHVEPLVCYWTAMHPQGHPQPWFQVSIHHPRFRRVNVFSMSNYLRTLKKDLIELEMPNVPPRLEWLRRLMPRG